jgi:hypothetical protein
MDPTQFSQDGAVTQPTFADPSQGGLAQANADPQVTGDAAGLQDQSGAPVASETPQSPAEPQVDYLGLWNQAAPRLQQYEQAFGQLQSMMAQAQQQAEEQAARTEAQSRIDRIYQLAETMPPEDSLRFIRQSEDQERANLFHQINTIRQRSEQEKWQVASQIAAPLYAVELGKQHQLPQDMIDRLQMMPPQQMDAYVPVLKAELAQRTKQQAEYQALLSQMNQLKLSQQANAMAATGAHNGGTGGAPLVTNAAGTFEAGSRDHLLSKLPPGFFGGGN